MSAQAAIYGRLGRDPETRETVNGKTMATGAVAVDLERRERGKDTERVPEWFDVIAFGRPADDLARHVKGDLLAVCRKASTLRLDGSEGRAAETVSDRGRQRYLGPHRAPWWRSEGKPPGRTGPRHRVTPRRRRRTPLMTRFHFDHRDTVADRHAEGGGLRSVPVFRSRQF